jgi:hypothetical protein
VSTKPSPGDRIAAALRRSPIYLDTSLASAVPPAQRAELLKAIKASPIPIYLVMVPLATGGDWPDARQLATVVHQRLGRDGAYVTPDKDAGSLNAVQWGGTTDQQDNTRDAAWAVGFYDDMEDATLGTRLLRCVSLIAGGHGSAEYRRLTAKYDSPTPSPSPKRAAAHHGDNYALPALGGGGVALAAVAALLTWRHRRMAAKKPLALPRSVFAAARKASEDELREHATAEVLALGELLDHSTLDTSKERIGALVGKALDAYQAAGKVLDSAHGIPDLAGALVLADQGRDALATAADGRPASPLCFFNPLHGDSAKTIDWRPIGSRRKLHVAACSECVKAARARETPDILMDGDVPYFEANTIWAETGYGQFRADLTQRVLRGDAKR